MIKSLQTIYKIEKALIYAANFMQAELIKSGEGAEYISKHVLPIINVLDDIQILRETVKAEVFEEA